MSEEYISRKSVRDAIASLSIERFELTPAYRLYVEALDNVDKRVVKIPAADVAPVRHGKWVEIDPQSHRPFWECSECKRRFHDVMWNYCPHCGAKMDAQKEDTDG